MNPSPSQLSTLESRRRIQQLTAAELKSHQLIRCNQLLQEILPTNRFYAAKFGKSALQLASREELSQLPYTFKSELIGDESTNGFAHNLTWPVDQYTRFHRTSGTRSLPLTVLDTARDWQWWLETWQPVLDVADVQSSDRVVMAFSFGPFIGFWSAFDAVIERQCLVAPTGAMTTLARLELVRALKATLIFCTPSYALHLSEVAQASQFDIRKLGVRALIVAGEPGGSIPAIREQIESAWQAQVIDHCGASEIGPWGFADPAGRGIHVNEAELIAEFISIESGAAATEGELSELVLTTLGRAGSPVIRYRTGDLVRPSWTDNQACNFVLLLGGVLGRTDDMMIVRGVNVFPSSIEQILRSFPEIAEYRLTAYKDSAMDQLRIEIEDRLDQPTRVKNELQLRLGLRIDVECVPLGSLPRYEAKGQRFVDKRQQED